MSLQALTFDAAGTLIRVAEPVGRTYAAFAARHGLQTDPDEVMRAFREVWKALSPPLYPVKEPPLDDDRGWRRLLVGNVFCKVLEESPPESVLDALFADLYPHYARPDAWAEFEDVLPALDDLSRDHRLLVLSNYDRRLRGILQGHDLRAPLETSFLQAELSKA